jgi:3-methyladenine DNA glycosylase AlkC
MTESLLNRKGAKKLSDIPTDVLELLNKGQLETVNLIEWLAIDYRVIVPTVFSELGLNQLIEPIIKSVEDLPKKTTMQVFSKIGRTTYELIHSLCDFQEIKQKLASHRSDTIRCYATYLTGFNQKITLEERLQEIQKFSADKHFGVREIAWIAVRPSITMELEKSIECLKFWTESKDDNIRRFASESTRPHGVWCNHIEKLKQNPEIALSILNPLKSDTSKYVQDSVGNWLNDASKSQPEFVKALCNDWMMESNTKETQRIVVKATRTLKSSKNSHI